MFRVSHPLFGFLTLATGLLAPWSATAQPDVRAGSAPAPSETANSIYVKILLPLEAPPPQKPRGKDEPAVESWIADDLEKRERRRYSAAIPWIQVWDRKDESVAVWNGRSGEKRWGCHVSATIEKRDKGRVSVRLDGWAPGVASVTVNLRDEPGSRKVTPLKEFVPDEGSIYVAVVIGPPTAKPADEKDKKK